MSELNKIKKLVIFDVDNTLIKGQSQRLLLNFLFKTKKINLFYYLVILFWFMAYKVNFVNNPRKIVSFAYSFLKGRNVNEVRSFTEIFFNDHLKKNIFPDAIIEIRNAQANQHEVILVSNAPSIIIELIASYLSINNFFCTQLEVKDQKYTGKVLGDVMYGINKLEVLNRFIETHGYKIENVTAYGDHLSDLHILQEVGHPIVVNPSFKLEKIARKKNWKVYNWKL